KKVKPIAVKYGYRRVKLLRSEVCADSASFGSLRRAPKNLFDFSGNPNATLTLRMIRLRAKGTLSNAECGMRNCGALRSET
ncbi:MAG: hypothetical protein IJT69_03885, partial [Clostridia bacterium]|nr:hypothetical protein [Clostridia bacterium]